MLSWWLQCDKAVVFTSDCLSQENNAIDLMFKGHLGSFSSQSVTVALVTTGNGPDSHCALAEVAPVVLYNVLVQRAIKQREWSPG